MRVIVEGVLHIDTVNFSTDFLFSTRAFLGIPARFSNMADVNMEELLPCRRHLAKNKK